MLRAHCVRVSHESEDMSGSDVLGRQIAFNATLVLSAIFGLFVSLSPNFPILCCTLLLLGTAVGVRLHIQTCAAY